MATVTARRHELLASVLAQIARDGEVGASGALRGPIAEVFGGFDGLVGAACQRWYAAFGARLDNEIETGERDPAAGAERAWRSLAADQPALHQLVTAGAGYPAAVEAADRQARLLRATTGVELAALSGHGPTGRPGGRHRTAA